MKPTATIPSAGEEHLTLTQGPGGWQASNPAGSWRSQHRLLGQAVQMATTYALNILGWKQCKLARVSEGVYRLERVHVLNPPTHGGADAF